MSLWSALNPVVLSLDSNGREPLEVNTMPRPQAEGPTPRYSERGAGEGGRQLVSKKSSFHVDKDRTGWSDEGMLTNLQSPVVSVVFTQAAWTEPCRGRRESQVML